MGRRQGNGIVIGIVIDLEDPDNLGRVRVRYPHLEDQESTWARTVSLMAGPERGAFFRPEVEDEVLIGFEHNDPRRPYVLGAVWNQTDPPPADDNKPKANNWRFFKSRSGHVIKMNDTVGAETIEIIDKDEQRRIVIDSASGKIQVICDAGDVEINASAGKVVVQAQEVAIKATGNMSLEAAGTMTISGATVNIN